MPNYTITPPLTTQALTVYNPSESVLPVYTITPPRTDQAATFFNPGETLLPLYHINPPLMVQALTVYDPRVFQIFEPDQILKNEVRRVS